MRLYNLVVQSGREGSPLRPMPRRTLPVRGSCPRVPPAAGTRLSVRNGRDLQARRVLEVLLDRAQLRGLDHRLAVLLRKARRQLDLEIDPLHHARRGIAGDVLQDLQSLG